MVKKIVLLYTAVLIAGFIQSCTTGGCDDQQTYSFRWAKVNTYQGYMDSVPGGYDYVSSQDSILTGKIFSVFVEVAPERIAMAPAGDGGIFSSACAKDCVSDLAIPVHRPLRLSVKTLKDFDAQHPANSDVTLFFSQQVYNSTGQVVSFEPFDSLFKPAEISHEDMRQLIKTLYLVGHEQTADLIQQFEISIHFSDSTVISATTLPVRRY